MSICHFRQFRISSALDDGRPLTASLQKHLEACEHCSSFYDQSQRLATRLIATPTPDETPVWLRTRILARIDASSPEPVEAHGLRWLPLAVAAVAIGIAALVFALNPNEPSPVPETRVAIPTVTTPVHPGTVPAELEKRAKDTLSREAQHLAADLRGARNFLTSSFRSTIPGFGGE